MLPAGCDGAHAAPATAPRPFQGPQEESILSLPTPLPTHVPGGFGEAPVGSVLAYAGVLPAPGQPASMAPMEAHGWMLCDGRALQAQRYPELFAVLGHVYGGRGDQFCIPDYRGYFLRGNGAGTQVDPDAPMRTRPPGGQGSPDGVGSIQQFAVQAHDHVYASVPQAVVPGGSGGPPASAASMGGQAFTSGPTSSQELPGDVRVSPYETRPVNVSVNYIIKFTAGLIGRMAAP